MISKVINGKEYLFVSVPENSSFYKINEDVLEFDPDLNNELGSWQYVKLPSPNLSIIGKANELTEEQWKEIVESRKVKQSWDDFISVCFTDYSKEYTRNMFVTATESGLSLISSIGMNPKTTLIILKQ